MLQGLVDGAVAELQAENGTSDVQGDSLIWSQFISAAFLPRVWMGIIIFEYHRRFYSFSWRWNKSRAASTKWTSLMTCKTGFDRHGCWKSVSQLLVYHVTKCIPPSGRWFWKELSFCPKMADFCFFFLFLLYNSGSPRQKHMTGFKLSQSLKNVRFTRRTSIPISRNSWPTWRQPSPSCRPVGNEKTWDRRSKICWSARTPRWILGKGP